MSSKQSEALKDHYRTVAAALLKNPPMPLDELRDLVDHWGDVTAEPGGVDYIETDAGGVTAMWAVPKGCAEDRVVVCLHGGGFINGSMYTHRKLFGHLAKAIGARALIVNYRRTPEHTHPAPVDDATATYRWLLDQGISAGHIALTGDSAGGGLTVTAMLRARERGLPTAAALMPISPWFDMELIGESMVSNRETDVLFGGKQPMRLDMLVHMFLGERGNWKDPLANPLYADITDLPPIYIQVGGDEMLLDDSRRLAEHARKASVDVRVDIFPEQQHAFQMSAGRAPEADEAIRRLADWVRPKLGLADAAQAASARHSWLCPTCRSRSRNSGRSAPY
jgi:monoterpene epsilon-lactone hydrolase